MENQTLIALSANQSLTMSTVEIAELTGKRHDNVMRVAKSLADKGIILAPQIEEPYTSGKGRVANRAIYLLNKTESLNLVANLSPEFTARIIDRWQELEFKEPEPVQQPRLKTAVEIAVADFEAIRSIAHYYDLEGSQATIHADRAVERLHQMSPMKLLGVDRLEAQDVYFKVTDIGLEVGLSARATNKALEKFGYQVKIADKWIATEKGKSYSRLFDVNVGRASKTQLKWNRDIIEVLKEELDK